MRGEEATDQRPGHAREAEHRAEDALVAAAVAWRHDVPDRRLRRDHQPAASESLDGAKRDQLRHVLRETAEGGADQEYHETDLQHDLAPVQVAELPVQRRHDRLSQKVGGHDPGQLLEAAELADDRRECRRDDRAVERGEQHHQHEAGEHDVQVARSRPLYCVSDRWLWDRVWRVHQAILCRGRGGAGAAGTAPRPLLAMGYLFVISDVT